MSKSKEFICTTDFDGRNGPFSNSEIRVFSSAAEAEEEFRKILGQDVDVFHAPCSHYYMKQPMTETSEGEGDSIFQNLHLSHVRSKMLYVQSVIFNDIDFNLGNVNSDYIIMTFLGKFAKEIMHKENAKNFAVFVVEDNEEAVFRFLPLSYVVERVKAVMKSGAGVDVRVSFRMRRVFSGFPMSELLMSDPNIDPRDMIMNPTSAVLALLVRV